jgi:hypothetical protein
LRSLTGAMTRRDFIIEQMVKWQGRWATPAGPGWTSCDTSAIRER